MNFVERKKHLQITNRRAIASTRGGNDDSNGSISGSNNGNGNGSVRRKQNHGNRSNDEEEDIYKLYERSSMLRQIAVDMLSPIPPHKQRQRKNDSHDPNDDDDHHHQQHHHHHNHHQYPRRKRKLLFLQGNEYLQRNELLEIAASQYELTGLEYCELMKNDGVWGGGPEIVALCNYLKRPIHVYELISIRPSSNHNNNKQQEELNDNPSRRNKKRTDQRKKKRMGSLPSSSSNKPEFRLRRMACFGSPKFDYREPLHILSADCRFPDLKPGQEASNGNHFLAMFPVKKGHVHRATQTSSHHESSTKRLGFKVRSGAAANKKENDNDHHHGRRQNNRQSIWNSKANNHVWKIIRNRMSMIRNNEIRQSRHQTKEGHNSQPESRRCDSQSYGDDRSMAVGDLLKRPYMSLMDHWVKIVASNNS